MPANLSGLPEDDRIVLDRNIYYIQNRFDSKKNNVFLVTHSTNDRKRFVLKRYSDEFKGNLKIEVRALKRLKDLDITAPEILFQSENTLLLDYIPGETVMDIINNSINEEGSIIDEIKLDDLIRIFQQIGKWFAELHAKTLDSRGNVLLKGDCVLKNFIYNPNLSSKKIKITAVDFEESIIGPPLLDLGSITAIILTIKPIFTEQDFGFLDQFMVSYDDRINKLVKDDISMDISTLDLANYAAQALVTVSKWHTKESAKELLKWADKFKTNQTIFKD